MISKLWGRMKQFDCFVGIGVLKSLLNFDVKTMWAIGNVTLVLIGDNYVRFYG